MGKSVPTIKQLYSATVSSPKQTIPCKSSSPLLPPARRDDDSSPLSSPGHNLNANPLQWSPAHTYDTVAISSLSPGPHNATFTCRIINIYDQPFESKMPQSAKGCLKLLVKDNNATLLIKLYYASTIYDLRLDTLITCWTTHIHSTASSSGFNPTTTKTGSTLGTVTLLPPSPIMTSIFPERDSGCHIQIHDEEESNSTACRIPLGYRSGQPLNGLMSLDAYIKQNGADRPDAKLLVCVIEVGEVVTSTSIDQSSSAFPA